MLPILLAVCLIVGASAVIVLTTTRGAATKRVNVRLAALDQEFEPTSQEEHPADIRKEQQKLSAIPWLNEWLVRLNLSATTSLFLYQAGVSTTLGALLLISMAGAAIAAYALYLRMGQTLPSVVLFFVALPAPFCFVNRMRNKRLSLLEQQLPEALAMMASALRVGHSLVASLGAVAQESPDPIGVEMRKCFEEQNYGIDLRTTLVNLTKRVPIQDFRIFVAAVLIQKESGGNLAEVLEKVTQTARERFRLKKQIGVHTAQGRMTGWVLSLMPFIIGTLMYLMNPDGMSILWKTDIGLKLLYGAIAMDAIGAFIISRIVRIRV